MAGAHVIVAETARLQLRRLALQDAAFYRELLNGPSWLASIGDRQVYTLADAQAHIRAQILAPYDAQGFGMYLVQRREDARPLGLCGLVQRDALPAPDLGFALLRQHERQGFAREAAQAVLRHAFGALALPRVLAVCAPANGRSMRLLADLGFGLAGEVMLGGRCLRLYALDAA